MMSLKKKFPIKLLGDLVAVQPKAVAQRGQVFLPDWSRSLQGSVLAFGPDVRELKKGDTVTFRATSGMESVFNGVAIRIMRADDIDMILEEA
jgi:co-chaperonin GroES (HSP10)